MGVFYGMDEVISLRLEGIGWLRCSPPGYGRRPYPELWAWRMVMAGLRSHCPTYIPNALTDPVTDKSLEVDWKRTHRAKWLKEGIEIVYVCQVSQGPNSRAASPLRLPPIECWSCNHGDGGGRRVPYCTSLTRLASTPLACGIRPGAAWEHYWSRGEAPAGLRQSGFVFLFPRIFPLDMVPQPHHAVALVFLDNKPITFREILTAFRLFLYAHMECLEY